MKKAIENMQKHPIAILILFVLGSLSSLITVALGFQEFVSDYLFATVEIPLMLFFVLLVVFIIFYVLKSPKEKKEDLPEEQILIQDQTFRVERVELDGKRFYNCVFDGTELVYRGKGGFSLEHNTFETMPRISFEDEAANTVSVIKTMRNEEVFREQLDIFLKE